MNTSRARMLWSMKNVTLRQLRVFAAAARHMNFSRAAEELHLSQPAVSTQIKEFASCIGLPLFERVGRKTYLTPAAEEMLQCAKAITQRMKEAEDALAQLKGVTGGRLNVAVISAGDYFFPRVLAAFCASHPPVAFAPHPYVIVAAPSHPLAGTRQIPRAALNRERCVQRERGSDTWNSMCE